MYGDSESKADVEMKDEWEVACEERDEHEWILNAGSFGLVLSYPKII